MVPGYGAGYWGCLRASKECQEKRAGLRQRWLRCLLHQLFLGHWLIMHVPKSPLQI